MTSFPPPRFSLNEAEALFDQSAYEALPALAAQAQHSLRAQFFLFGGPDANALLDIFAAKQAQGVRVSLTLDRALGRENFLPGIVRECVGTYRYAKKLGLDVSLSDRLPPPEWPRKPVLAHHKFLVVDEREALVGGVNLGTLFRRYHDLFLRLRGPAALDLARQFDFDRAHALDPALTRPLVPPASDLEDAPADAPPPAGTQWRQTRARILGTGLGRRTTEPALRRLLAGARESVCVAVCEMGRTEALDALIACHRRGVSVRVLLDPMFVSRLSPPAPLNMGAIGVLREAGVPVHLYRLGRDFLRLHLKMAIFDGTRALAGSTNWTRAGFAWVGETDAELHGGAAVGQLLAQFERDWLRSDPAPPPSRLAQWQYGLYERLTQ